jgi:hypothetical protein
MKNEFKPMKVKETKRYANSYPSVTQVLGVLRKVGLEMWFKKNTEEFCNAESAKGKKIGTQIHSLIQAYIDGKEPTITSEYDFEIKNAVKSFAEFKRTRPAIKLQAAEIKLVSEAYKYNGTLDALATYEDELCICDWKTGKAGENYAPPIYDEYYAQVAAYVKAYNDVYQTNIKKAFIIVFAKDKPAHNHLMLNEQMIDFHFTNIFLPALQIYNAQKQIKEATI